MLDHGARLALNGTRFGDVRWFDEIDSTNTYLLAEARAGAPEGVVAVADHQTAGRGRLGRTWTAPPGSSLLVSVLLRPPLPVTRAHLATATAALAGIAACTGVAGFAPQIKWPNDLLVGDRKLAGVLAEADVGGDGELRAVVVGMGLNVNWPRDLPEELAAIATAANHVAGHDVDRADLLVGFLDALDETYALLLGSEREVVRRYRGACATLGQAVRVELADETFTGTAADVTDDGHLLVDVGACIREVAAGDVVHLRKLS